MIVKIEQGGDILMVKRRKRNSFVETCVKGVRAEKAFWDKCDLIAKKCGVTRNALIVKFVENYIDEYFDYEVLVGGVENE